MLWNELRTIIVYRSKNFYKGQLRGINKNLNSRLVMLEDLNRSLANPRCKKKAEKT